jgi:SAM-dependent methyltransferase
VYTQILSVTRVGVLAVLLAFALEVDGRGREDCERDYKPQRGQSGKDVVWMPTDDSLVVRMLDLAKVTRADRVYDLGAGDGKIAITAGKRFGATAVGIEYNPQLVQLAQCLADVEGVANRVRIQQGDIFESDFKNATVVTLYLLPDLNLRLRPTLLEMTPGTRVVSHSYAMSEWKPDEEASTDAGQAYLWIVPAKVAGEWTFERRSGKDKFTVNLEQTFQELRGTAGESNAPLTQVKLQGSQIGFTFKDGRGLTQVAGRVNGHRIEATVTRNGGTSKYIGTRM